MAPGAFALLAPLLRRKKKYEKLETEDPEKKSRRRPEPEVYNNEIERLNTKIERLVTSLSKDDYEPALSPDEQCIVCNQSKAVMQVSPCGHQCQCRICFIYKIQEAVSSRDLPLRCLICNVKIFRVKNNSHIKKKKSEPSLPKSASGYSIVPPDKKEFFPHSSSNYSISSDVSSLSTSSRDSKRSIKSSNSWFSLGSLSNFQAGCILMDKDALSKCPRAHSLISGNKSGVRRSSTETMNDNQNKNISNLNNHIQPMQSSNHDNEKLLGGNHLRRSRTMPLDMGRKRNNFEEYDGFNRSPVELVETAFSMSTITEED